MSDVNVIRFTKGGDITISAPSPDDNFPGIVDVLVRILDDRLKARFKLASGIESATIVDFFPQSSNHVSAMMVNYHGLNRKEQAEADKFLQTEIKKLRSMIGSRFHLAVVSPGRY